MIKLLKIFTLNLIVVSLVLGLPRINKNGTAYALGGYDTVAFFTQNKPIKGSTKISYKWQGATWLFSSQATKNKFKQNPKKYAPQYGGYCAYAVSRNYTKPVQIDTFKVYKGRLYVNYNSVIKKRWNKDKDTYIKRANGNWPQVLKQ